MASGRTMSPYTERELHGCRTKWTDPDFRPRPLTPRNCLMCGKDLKPGKPARQVQTFRDTFSAIHPADYPAAKATGEAVEPWLLGPDCARRLGLEWSTEEGIEL